MPNELRITRVYDEFSRIGQALATPGRIVLLELLAQGPRAVDALAKDAGLSVANASRHLQVLRGARLVEGTRDGQRVYYRLADPQVFALLSTLRALAERQLPEVGQLVRQSFGRRREDDPAVEREALLDQLRFGDVRVLDVRPYEEYAAGHVAGALNVPLEDLPVRAEALAKEREIVAYSRGPYCPFSRRAVAFLRERGFRARRLADGFPEWRAAGLPVEQE